MKLTHIFGLGAAVVMFASCESTLFPDTPVLNEGKAIRISSVSQNDFVSDANSRSTFSDTYATVFEEGDQLGLILVDNDGKQIANVPFTFTEGEWSNDRHQLYQSDVTKVVAYAPYNANLPADVCDVNAVKNAAQIANDQSDIESLKASDLLVCELENPSDVLAINFSHAFSMMRFSAKGSVKAGDNVYDFAMALENLKVNVGNDIYTPCLVNGSYVCIVKDGTDLLKDDFKYTYTRVGEERATKTIVNTARTNAGTIYSFPCPSTGATTEGLSAGSYYCVAEGNGQVVTIPAGAATIPAGLKCQGIVFHTMDNAAFAGFAADNGLNTEELPGIEGKHGLIVNLEQGGVLLKDYNDKEESQIAFLKSVFEGNDEAADPNKSLGYKNTQVLAEAYDGSETVTFTGLEGIEGSLPHCTKWYVPSFNELKYLVRGSESVNVVSTVGLESINNRISAAGGTIIEGNLPCVTYRESAAFYIMENGNAMGWIGVPTGEKCRPVCAF